MSTTLFPTLALETVREWQREFVDSSGWRSAYAALKRTIDEKMPPIHHNGRIIASWGVRRRTVGLASCVVTTYPTGSEGCAKAELHPDVAAALKVLQTVEQEERVAFMRRCALSDYADRLLAEIEVENG